VNEAAVPRATVRASVLVVVLAACVIAVVVARRTGGEQIAAAVGAGAPAAGTPLPVLPGGPAPDVTAGATGWLNSDPLPPAALAGKVVLYDFWTFGCINCQHTLPAVKAWHARYAADGLVVLSIHTPEFAHEADPANVTAALTEQAVTYPVALDADRAVWRAFANHYWPAFFLYDRDGRPRYTHVGEGAYATTEDAIRALLGVDPASPRATVAG
jgi:thiol-disulfide isomerase/thioredoxin